MLLGIDWTCSPSQPPPSLPSLEDPPPKWTDLPALTLSLSGRFSAQVEDGGKAALSQKMRSGDELVNINGTPLYGSRQEALILIKGSYRTLKMILRR